MAHEGLWEQVEKLDGTETAQRAKCQYFDNQAQYIVTLLNTEYMVNLSDRNIFSRKSDSQQEEAKFLEQLCVLAYLINSKDLPLAQKLVAGNTLPGGQFFFRGQHGLPTQKLEEAFGNKPGILHQVSANLGSERCEFGDASICLYMLPRLPLTIVIWGRDEEFEARASILFDQTAASQLPLDALLAAVNITVEALLTNITESG
ncbi:MAG: DUF3786 domain-containing protein [Planctomycetes bacterium]|nr:DUF3786 domain-containing protein [Planctomycetota bacterium]